MRIYEIITPSRIGGAETQVVTLTKALQAMGDDVWVFCPQGRPFADYLLAQGITPVSWKTHGKVDPMTIWRHAAFIKRRDVEIVHAHLTSGAFLGSLGAHWAGRPCIATVHGFTNPGWYQHADLLIAVSPAVKDHLLTYDVEEEKIRVITNGIPIHQYAVSTVTEAKLALGLNPVVPRVGIVGRLSPEKGQDLALRAWPKVLSQAPNAHLVLIGDGQMLEEWQALAQKLGIAAVVEFAGFVADPRAAMAACDLIVVPSRKEGLGLAAVEAMALARPVVATAVGGLKGVVVDSVTGLFVPTEDVATLALTIAGLLRNPARAIRLGAYGRQHAQTHFDVARQVALLRDTFAETIQSRYALSTRK